MFTLKPNKTNLQICNMKNTRICEILMLESIVSKRFSSDRNFFSLHHFYVHLPLLPVEAMRNSPLRYTWFWKALLGPDAYTPNILKLISHIVVLSTFIRIMDNITKSVLIFFTVF